MSASRAIRVALRGAFLDNLALKFVAFVLALTVFILVHSDETATVAVHVKLAFKGADDRVLVSPPQEQVLVQVSGPWRRVKRLDPDDVELAPVDLTNFKSGRLTLTPDMFKTPPRVAVTQVSPATITMEFEPRIERVVAVVPLTIGEPARGYGIAPPVVVPDTVTIFGAESAVRLTSQVHTEDIPLTGRRQSFSATAGLKPPRRFVNIKNTSSVQVEVTLVEEQRTRELGLIPVAVRAGAGTSAAEVERFSAQPGSVRVVLRGTELAIDRVINKDVHAFVEVLAEDRERRARVLLEGVPEGVAFDVVPREVLLRSTM